MINLFVACAPKIAVGTAPPLVAVKITVNEAIETSQLELESRKMNSELSLV